MHGIDDVRLLGNGWKGDQRSGDGDDETIVHGFLLLSVWAAGPTGPAFNLLPTARDAALFPFDGWPAARSTVC
jgi:hypothetical protein